MTDMADISSALNDPKVRELLGPDAMSIAKSLDVNIDTLGDLADTANGFLDHTRVTASDVSAEDFYRQELDRIGARTARDAAVGDRIVQSADERLAGSGASYVRQSEPPPLRRTSTRCKPVCRSNPPCCKTTPTASRAWLCCRRHGARSKRKGSGKLQLKIAHQP